LPRVEQDRLRQWDTRRNACCGYLNKKAGKTSSLSRGKWQKRWFVIKIQLTGHENYTLSYYHGPDDRSARQTFPLDNARINIVGGANVANAFELICLDDSNITLGADSRAVMQTWVDTLLYVIEVATDRGKVQRERWGGNPTDSIALKSARQVQDTAAEAPQRGVAVSREDEEVQLQKSTSGAFTFQHHRLPTVRVNVDINTMPPGSTQRNQFEEMFINDLARALSIQPRFIEIISVKPAPGMDWLTLVEFDLYAHEDRIHEPGDDYDEEKEHSLQGEEEDEAFMAEKRMELLQSMEEMIKNPSSLLYSGFITSNLDPTYVSHIVTSAETAKAEVEIISSDPIITKIMNKYKTVQLPGNFVDISHFTVFLRFEGNVRPLAIPNPMVLRKKFCMLWPFEVKQALGFMGNMQELWIEPLSLTPSGLPAGMAKAIYFEPSARLGGALVISATRLKAGLTYDVQFDDRRSDIVKMLTDEERRSIEQTFETYDVNRDGTVSRRELEELLRSRTNERKQIIDAKFAEFMSETSSDEDVMKAEEFRRMHYQQLTEAQSKLIKMFENADIDGSGSLSFTEFILAEAYWLRCTLNPEHAALF
jgi:Ca2+-binding EF-hand superfamily protein